MPTGQKAPKAGPAEVGENATAVLSVVAASLGSFLALLLANALRDRATAGRDARASATTLLVRLEEYEAALARQLATAGVVFPRLLAAHYERVQGAGRSLRLSLARAPRRTQRRWQFATTGIEKLVPDPSHWGEASRPRADLQALQQLAAYVRSLLPSPADALPRILQAESDRLDLRSDRLSNEDDERRVEEVLAARGRHYELLKVLQRPDATESFSVLAREDIPEGVVQTYAEVFTDLLDEYDGHCEVPPRSLLAELARSLEGMRASWRESWFSKSERGELPCSIALLSTLPVNLPGLDAAQARLVAKLAKAPPDRLTYVTCVRPLLAWWIGLARADAERWFESVRKGDPRTLIRVLVNIGSPAWRDDESYPLSELVRICDLSELHADLEKALAQQQSVEGTMVLHELRTALPETNGESAEGAS